MRFWQLLLIFSGLLQADTTTAQSDNSRGSYNSSETILTTNLTTANFGLLGSFSVDGAVYAQTLYVSSTTLCAAKSLFVATMHGSVYCFDATRLGSAPVWKSTLVTPVTTFIAGATPNFYHQEIGCVSTPVVDVSNNAIYVSCATNTPSWVLFKLNATTGVTIGSVTEAGQVTGTGCVGKTPADTTSGANLVFYPAYALQRAPLTMIGSTVMVAFAAQDDVGPWHGWVMTYDVSGDTPTQTHIWNSTPNGCGGGIWQSGGGLASDGSFFFLSTGNGDYNGITNFGMSIVKLSSNLTVSDWWTPTNYADLNTADADFSSGRVMIIPGTSNLTFGAKDFYVRLIDGTNMGHLSASPTQQFLTNLSPPATDYASGIYGGAFANGQGFFQNHGGKIYAFSYSGGAYNTTPVATPNSFAQTQGMTISSNSGSSEILWAITNDTSAYATPQVGTLRAINPATMTEYWNSGTSLGQSTKFHQPTVADGRVYVGGWPGQVKVFGSIPQTAASVSGNISIQ